MRKVSFALALVLSAAALALCQTQSPSAVPVTSERHHHLVFSSEYVRIFHVEVPGHESTLLHQHDLDYIWLALGNADVINAVAGKPEARLKVEDGTIHYSRGGFAHIARNETGIPFRNATIELLQPQSNHKNMCADVLPGAEQQNCPDMEADPKLHRFSVTFEFQTDQTLVDLLEIKPEATMQVSRSEGSAVLIALEGTAASLVGESVKLTPGYWAGTSRTITRGSVLESPANSAIEIRNTGKNPARFLVLEFRNAGR